MKQEETKKKKLWLWIVLAVAALAIIAGAVGAFVLFNLPGGSGAAIENPKLYWNLDRAQYMDSTTGMSNRDISKDGYFHFRYVVDGKVEDISVTHDRRLANYLDSQPVLCLVFDDNGIVVDAVDPSEYYTVLAKEVYVKRTINNVMEINSAMLMNGMDSSFPLDGDIGPYDVMPGSENPGAVLEPQWLDVVSVYGDANGEPVAIFVSDNVAIDSVIGWRMNQKYLNGSTTRVPDENGYYTIEFAVDGEIVEYKCNNLELVTTIDGISINSAGIALEFDENGYIVDFENILLGMPGYLMCESFTVDAIDGNMVYASRHLNGSNKGETIEFTYDENCVIYQVCAGKCQDHHFGERITSLQVGDTFNAYANFDNETALIYVARRKANVPMYHNLSGNLFNYTTRETARVPDENGYYTYEMTWQGKVQTLRTKDKAIASQIDYAGSSCMGLEVSGTIIKRFYSSMCVSGNNAAFQGNYFVMETAGPILSYAPLTDLGAIRNIVMTEDCEIYDVSKEYGTKPGEKTELRPYDRISAFKNMHGEITHVYVFQRYVPNHKLCYNMTRQYDYTKKETTRVPDAEGYYVIELAMDGSIKDYKTKNKKLVDFIDSKAILAVKVSGTTIKSACTAAASIECGIQWCSGGHINSMKDGIVSASYMDQGKPRDYAYSYAVSKNAKIYNISEIFNDHQGEKTSLKLNDSFYGLVNGKTQEIVGGFIPNRCVDSPLYYHVGRLYDSTKKETTRKPDAEGYYVFELLSDGVIKEFKTKDKDVATSVDKQSYAFGLILKKGTNIIEQGIASASTKYFNTLSSGRVITSIKGKVANIRNCDVTSSSYGGESIMEFTNKTKVYDVSAYAKTFGQKTKLEVGDRLYAYADIDGVADYVFVVKKGARKEGVFDYCEHCKKKAYWEAYTATYLADYHYYLPTDRVGRILLGADDGVIYDYVFDLNGYTFTGVNSVITVNDKATLIDSVGGGKIFAGVAGDHNGLKAGGNIFVSEGAVFTMESGVLENGNATPTGFGGNIAAQDGTVNIKGGSISGGFANIGTAIYHTGTKGGVNISGGTINGTVYAEESGKITVSGKPDVNMILIDSGNKINVGNLKSGAHIVVKADGVFTDKLENAEAYLEYFVPANAADKIVVDSNGALKYVNNSEPVLGGSATINDPLVLDANNQGMCNFCGEVVTWVAINSTNNVMGNQQAFLDLANTPNPEFDADKFSTETGAHYHFYLEEDVTSPSDRLFLLGYMGSINCFHLNGKNLTLNGGIYVGNGATINVFGDGTVNRTAAIGGGNARTCIFEAATGTVNVYGGKYTGETGFVNPIGAGASYMVAYSTETTLPSELSMGKMTLFGGAKVGNVNIGEKGQLVIDKSFSGAAKVKASGGLVDKMIPEANGIALGDYAGTLTYVDGRTITNHNGRLLVNGDEPSANSPLVLTGNKGFCNVCYEEVTWIPLHGGESIGTITTANGYTGKKLHYYIAEDNMISADGTFGFIDNSNQVCLHLNGKTAHIRAGFYTQGGGALNIMGEGTLNHLGDATFGNGMDDMFWMYTSTIRLYGGTYETNENFTKIGSGASQLYFFEDAVANETATWAKGKLYLGGSAKVQKINVTSGLVTVMSGYKGTAMLDFDSSLVNAETGIVNAANGTYLGAFDDASIYTSAGNVIKGVENDTTLVITTETVTVPPITDDKIAAPKPDPNVPLVLDAQSKGKCNVCGSVVTWVPISDGESIGVITSATGYTGQKLHYYLADDNMVTATGNFIQLENSNQVCLHLNGKTAHLRGSVYNASGGVLNIMGEGTLNYLGVDVNKTFFRQYTSTVRLYGGTYESNENFVQLFTAGAKMYIMGDAIVNETATVTNGVVYLGDAAKVQKIVANAGLISVMDGYDGTAVVDFATSLVNATTGVVNAANGAYDGTFTIGALYTSAGKVIKGVANAKTLMISTDTVTVPPSTDDNIAAPSVTP